MGASQDVFSDRHNFKLFKPREIYWAYIGGKDPRSFVELRRNCRAQGLGGGDPGVRANTLFASVSHVCSFLIGFILKTDSCRWHRWQRMHPQLLGFVTSCLSTPEERESSTQSIYISLP